MSENPRMNRIRWRLFERTFNEMREKRKAQEEEERAKKGSPFRCALQDRYQPPTQVDISKEKKRQEDLANVRQQLKELIEDPYYRDLMKSNPAFADLFEEGEVDDHSDEAPPDSTRPDLN